jgi:hypothetical protein
MRTFMAKEARWIGQKWTTKSIGVTHVRVEHPDEPAKSTTKYRPPGDTERIKPRSRIGRDDPFGISQSICIATTTPPLGLPGRGQSRASGWAATGGY